MMRKLFLAALLALSLSPAFAQVPPPVPALPDAERRISYSISASTCSCALNMAIFGDGVDYQNWVEVFINGTRVNYNDATFGWTITSPTGPLASIPRPVTNAVLTFNSPQTGTIQIVGARRPRRTSQFNENQGVPARNLNQVLTDIISQNREIWDKTNDMTGRALLSQPGVTLGLLPPPTACANGYLKFDPTGRNPICSPASGGSPTTTISLKNVYGVVADGVTSDLAAFNSAIAFANANGGNITFTVPVGTSGGCVLLDGAPTPIIVNNVFFKGEGTPRNSCIKTTAAQGLQWSTTTTAVDGGGLLDVGLEGNGGINNVAVMIPFAFRITLDNVYLNSGVAQLSQIGSASAGTGSAQISFTRLRGLVANVAVPLISALNGAGLYIRDYDLFVNASFGSQVSGRNFVTFSQGSWDTAQINDGIVQVFDSPLVIAAESGKGIQSISMYNTFNDQNLRGMVANAVAGGFTYAVELYDNEITARGSGGACVSIIGAGSHIAPRIIRNRMLQCNQEGVSLPATASLFSVQANDIYAVNQGAGAFNGITVAAGADGLISGNKVGRDVSGLIGQAGVPPYGISVGNSTNVQVIGNVANGSTAGCLLGSMTARSKVRANVGSTSGVVDTSCKDQPALTVGEGGTGLTAGTSGGIPYFNSTSTMATSALLTQNALVLGGGAAGSPAPLGSLGTTSTVLHGNAAGAPAFGSVALSTDVSGAGTGVLTALGVNVGTAGSVVVNGGALGTPSSGVATNITALNATQLTTGTVPAARTNGHQNGTATNDNGAAGEIGEFLSNSGTNISLTSGVGAQVATVTLTAGDWDVWGGVQYIPAGTTTSISILGLVSLTSASVTAVGSPCLTSVAYAGTAGATQSLPVGVCRVSVSTGTPVYVNIDAFFAVSTAQGNGTIYARRAR